MYVITRHGAKSLLQDFNSYAGKEVLYNLIQLLRSDLTPKIIIGNMSKGKEGIPHGKISYNFTFIQYLQQHVINAKRN